MDNTQELRSAIDQARIRITDLMGLVDELWGRPLIEHSEPDFAGHFLAWAVPVPDKAALLRTRWVVAFPVGSDRYTDTTDTYQTFGTKVTKTKTFNNLKTKTPNRNITKSKTININKYRYIPTVGTTTTTTTTTTNTTTDTTTSTTTTTVPPPFPTTTTTTSTQPGTVKVGDIYHFTGGEWIVTDNFITTDWETPDFSTGTFTETTTKTQTLTAETTVNTFTETTTLTNTTTITL